MAAFLHDNVLDQGVKYIDDNVAVLHILSQAVTSYADAGTYSLGNKTPPTCGVPENGASTGRRVIISAVTDGTVTGTDTATHFALVSADTLLVCQALSAPQAVTSGNTFTLTAISITIPDPTA